jgi:hypothetical protein
MDEIQNQPFQLSFHASLQVDFQCRLLKIISGGSGIQGSRVTSDPSAKASGRRADGGLILVRELDERLGFGEFIEQHLTDSRRGKNTQFPFADLLRPSVDSRLAD